MTQQHFTPEIGSAIAVGVSHKTDPNDAIRDVAHQINADDACFILAFVPGGAVGPLILAEAHRLFGHYRPGFIACIGLTCLACVSLAFLRRVEPSREGVGPAPLA